MPTQDETQYAYISSASNATNVAIIQKSRGIRQTGNKDQPLSYSYAVANKRVICIRGL